MKYGKYYLIIIFVLLIKLSLVPYFKSKELGSKDTPITFLLTPSVDAEKIATSADELTRFLHNETGLHFQATFPTSYIAVVEAFGNNKADFACMNTFSYVLAHEKYGVKAAMRIIRRNGELTYKGQFIARSDSGIDSLSDIIGKRIAYVDAASTSGYILPKSLLAAKKIKPSDEVFGMRHDNVVTMVYQKQVDVGATYYSPPDPKTGENLDARVRVKSQYPDIEKTVKIIGYTQEIPNDPWVFRHDMPQDIQKKICDALIKFQATPKGKKALFETNSAEGLSPVSDSDYDVLRAMIRRFGGNLEALLQKKK
ncbi:MAG: phosphate/phosphite/phosphonate ABC transporter substrate-binding protein [Candidatus Kapaibacterium sp.]|jgi:phosphonate transport system substrate-binding protein